MPDDATFEFSSDEDTRLLNEQMARQAAGFRTAKKSLENEKKFLNEAEILAREIEVARGRIAKKRVRDRAARFMSTPQSNPDDPDIVLGGRNSALNPLRRRPNWRDQETPGQMSMERDPDKKDVEFLPDMLSPTKGKKGQALEKNVGRFSSGLDKAVSGLAALNPVVTGLAAAFTASMAALEGAKGIRKETMDSLGGKAQVVGRAAMVLGLDRNTLMEQVTHSPDEQGAIQFLQERTKMKQTQGIGLKADQANMAFNSVGSGAADWNTVNSLSKQNAFYMLKGAQGFDKDSLEGKYTNIQRGTNAAQYDAQNSQIDQEMKDYETAMYDEAAWKAFQVKYPKWASVPFSRTMRSMKTSSEARRMADDYGKSLYTPDQSGGHFGTTQTPVRQPDVDITSGGRGRQTQDAATAGARAAAEVIRNSRRPDPRSGNRPGE